MSTEKDNSQGAEREVGIFRPSEDQKLSETPESITAGERLPHVSEYEGIRLEKLPIKGLKAFLYAASVLVLMIAGRQLYLLFHSAWEAHWTVFSLLTLFIAFLLIKSLLLIKEVFWNPQGAGSTDRLQQESAKLRKQRSFGNAPDFIQELQDFYEGKPQAVYLSRSLDGMPDYSNDSEAIDYLEKTFLEPLDKEAMRRVSNYSAQAGLAVAVSPWAAADMLLALWRCLRMIDDVSQVYGIRPSFPNRIRLMKQVVNYLIVTGATEIIIDQVFDDIGIQAVTGMLKARVGQGIGVGIYCSRIGLSAMTASRPVRFEESLKPKLRSLINPLVSNLTSLIKKTM